MTSDTIYYAWLDAPEKLNFQFPYEGGSIATISLEFVNKINVFTFSVTKGQIVPPASGPNRLLIRFDNDTAKYYQFEFPSDGRRTMNYINYYIANDLIERLKKATSVKILATYYRDGDKIAEFYPAGLDWNHKGIRE